MNANPIVRNRLRVVALLLSATACFAGSADPVYKDGSGAAIRGYDPVAYFMAKEPVKGSDAYSYSWMGATWKFASAENREHFKADPARFAPQYGGYCSYAVSRGHTAAIDPAAWRIVDGKLYLNYSKSVQSDWAKDIPGNIEKADRNWPGLHK